MSYVDVAKTAPLALTVVLCGCGVDEHLDPVTEPAYEPPAAFCDTPDLARPDRFVPCNAGGGIFGEWQLDEAGLPSYYYGLDQHRDRRAHYDNTEGLDRRDHWAAFGNRRINAWMSNDGLVEVVTQDRGVEYLNKLDPAQGNYAGGFSVIDDGERVWNTAYVWRPPGSIASRRFGMGYAESSLEHRQLRVARISAAPPGDAPLLVTEVTIENLGEQRASLSHYEVWDVGRRPIEINWLASGEVFSAAPESAARARDERNGLFDETVSWDGGEGVLGVRRSWVGPSERLDRETPSATDHYPAEPFLAVLSGPVDDIYSDQATFFGASGPRNPAAVVARAPGQGTASALLGAPASALGQPRVLVVRSDLELDPGESRVLRFAYGYAPWGEPFSEQFEPARAMGDLRATWADYLRERLFYFATERAPVLQRELAWDSYQIEASIGHRDYWGGHVVPQGSAYLYLHGADGAARDLGIFAVPLVYLDPALAREELRLYMGLQLAQGGAFAYAFQGHGMVDDAGIHTAPSDLPIFFLWALGEYLGATGDWSLLDEVVPFYPREALAEATGWDHLEAATRHLFDVIGTGEHGLVRIQTGDWSDGIVVAAPDRELAVAAGESVPNTQMAVAVLPRVADLIASRDAALADEIRTRVAAYRAALPATYNGRFFYRAYYGDGVPVSADSVNLESQVWGLIGDTFAEPGQRDQLVDEIASQLDDPSAVGAALWSGGEMWPAIAGLLSWGYALSQPERAWAHLARNTLAARAEAFPEVWYGIWSGPDGVSTKSGQTWASQVTPMRDFPVQNNNQHTMPILAALRVAGVDATAAGLRIAPSTLGEPFALRCRLLDLSLRGDQLSGSYRPTGQGGRTLTVVAPPATAIAAAVSGGVALAIEDPSRISLSIPASGSTFEVTFVPAG